MAMKTCPVSGCGRRCSNEYLMCRSDWWRVKPEARDEVYATWRALEAGTAAGSTGQQALSFAYRAARREAIEQAEESRSRALSKPVDGG